MLKPYRPGGTAFAFWSRLRRPRPGASFERMGLGRSTWKTRRSAGASGGGRMVRSAWAVGEEKLELDLSERAAMLRSVHEENAVSKQQRWLTGENRAR